MLVHSVFFWLRDDVTAEQRQEFNNELEKLKSIDSANAVYVGTPASTDRPVIDRSYDFALTLIFDDMAAHNDYQVDPAHQAFLEKCKPMFERVLIYDAD